MLLQRIYQIMSGVKIRFISRGKVILKGSCLIIRHNFRKYGGGALQIDASQRVYFGPNTMITCCGEVQIGYGFSATEFLRLTALEGIIIGNNVLIGSSVTIMDCNHGTDPDIQGGYLNQKMITDKVIIEDGVWCGDHVIILPGVTIGQHSIIGAGSIVTKSIPEYCIAVGNPAKVIKRWSAVNKRWERL